MENKGATILYISYILHPKYSYFSLPLYLYMIYRYLKPYNIIPGSTTDRFVRIGIKSCAQTNKNSGSPTQTVKNPVSEPFYSIVSSKKRISRLCEAVFDENLPQNSVVVPKNIYINLKLTENGQIRFENARKNDFNLLKKIEICPILTPVEYDDAFLDYHIKQYFKTPRIVYLNDFLAIPIDLTRYPQYNVVEIAFKVSRVTQFEETRATGGFCVLNETEVVKSRSLNCFLPLGMSRSPVAALVGGLNLYKRLHEAVATFIRTTKSDLRPVFSLCGRSGLGKRFLMRHLADTWGLHVHQVDTARLGVAQGQPQVEMRLRQVLSQARRSVPCLLVFNNFQSFGKDVDGHTDQRLVEFFQRELFSNLDNLHLPLIVFCLSNFSIPTEFSRLFLENFQMENPDDVQRLQILKHFLNARKMSCNFPLEKLVRKTTGFVFRDLELLVGFSVKKHRLSCENHKENILTEEDFQYGLDLMQSTYAENLGAPKIPKVLWEDIGGLQELKMEILRTISLPLLHPHLLKNIGLKRSGILLYGPPGTGKTLIAKAVATECALCFLSVKGPELLNMYVGQSEENIRNIFEKAREASPCIVFFDELDSLAPNRGISGDSGGVMDRVVSQLLAEMDGLGDHSKTVFVIGATNRPDLIDPALLRPGRFDKLLYVGPCESQESKISVLKALTRKFNLGDDVDFYKLSESLAMDLTGADLYSICAQAWMSAVSRKIALIEKEGLDRDVLDKNCIVVLQRDFLEVQKTFKPSMSAEEMLKFKIKSN